MGAKVQRTPEAAASTAAIRAPASASSGFQVAAIPSGMGKIVRKPWITSRPMSSGIPSRLSVTATRCSRLITSTSTSLRIEPSLPARTASSWPAPEFRWLIWPSFSSRVIFASSSSMLRSCCSSSMAPWLVAENTAASRHGATVRSHLGLMILSLAGFRPPIVIPIVRG